MLDVMTPGAAVFEPEEVDVLTAACSLALRKIGVSASDDPETSDSVARLVHNLARSRLRHRKALKDAADAASLAEEAADLLGYLTSAPALEAAVEQTGASTRAVPIFPRAFRAPPVSVLKPRPVDLGPQASPGAKVSARRPGRSSRPRKSG